MAHLHGHVWATLSNAYAGHEEDGAHARSRIGRGELVRTCNVVRPVLSHLCGRSNTVCRRSYSCLRWGCTVSIEQSSWYRVSGLERGRMPSLGISLTC